MRIYRWLSKCFPAAFRDQYQAELEAAAADLIGDEGAKGRLRRARLWAGLWIDAVTRGIVERRSEAAKRAPLWRSITSETRQAIRAIVSRPGLAVIVIGLLGLGMGANAAVFGVVNATLLRPLPFSEPERLVLLWERYAPMHLETMPWSDPDYLDARAAKAFEAAAMFRPRNFVFTGSATPVRLHAIAVEGNLFDVLGVSAELGRVFTSADSDAGAEDLVVLAHGTWVDRFNRDPNIVGRAIVLDNRPRTIVGVLPAGVSFPPPITFGGQMLTSEPNLYVPYKPNAAAEARGAHGGFAVARLRDGVDGGVANDEVAAIGRNVASQFPDSNSGIEMYVAPLHGQSVMTIRGALYLLLASVAGVLLIACASISNLMLARASGRAREMALRTALGAGRASLVRQMMLESAILGAAGMAIGLVLAQWMSSALVAINPIELPEMFRASLDGRVLAFAVAIMMATVGAFGLVPAVAASRTDLVSVLRNGTRTSSAGGERRTKSALVVLQVSLAMVLLVGCGLTTRSLARLWKVDPGFQPNAIVTTAVRLPESQYPTATEQRAFQQRWLARVRALPGVNRAATMTLLPFSFDKSASDYTIAGEARRKTGDYLIATFDYVSADFAGVLGVPVIEGRGLNDGDNAQSPLVTVVSESLARRHWPPGRAVGHQLRFGDDPDETPKTIVGVVRDIRMEGFSGRAEPTIYVPQDQSPAGSFWTAISTARDAGAIAPDLRAALREIDAALPLESVRPLTDIMGDTIKKPRFTAVVMSAFGAIALLIAAIGLYGVLAFDVAQQWRELGIRIALGATPRSIRSVVLRRGFGLVGTGLVIGVAVSLALTKSISGQLFDAPELDVVPLAAATLALAAAALLATWLPARRATRADPIEALRAQ
jgi:putative ABC transport system permease protein